MKLLPIDRSGSITEEASVSVTRSPTFCPSPCLLRMRGSSEKDISLMGEEPPLFLLAALAGDEEALREQLAAGADVQRHDHEGAKAPFTVQLHMAKVALSLC